MNNDSMQLKLSIVIPIYNAQKYLNKCLESIIHQTYKNIEIILVNDGSKDTSDLICKNFCNKDSRFVYVEQENSGSQAARNNGVLKATGNYITFVDSDDWVEKDYYEKVFAQFGKDLPDIFCTGFIKENNSKSEILKNKITSGFYNRDSLKEILKKSICFENLYYESGIFPNNWTKFFKADIAKKIFPQVNSFIKLGEDAVCTYGILSYCKSLQICNEITSYHYVNNETSIVNSFDRLYFERLNILIQNLLLLIDKGLYTDVLRSQCILYFSFMIDYGFNGFKSNLKRTLPLGLFKFILSIKQVCSILNLSDRCFDSLSVLPVLQRKRIEYIKDKNYFALVRSLF